MKKAVYPLIGKYSKLHLLHWKRKLYGQSHNDITLNFFITCHNEHYHYYASATNVVPSMMEWEKYETMLHGKKSFIKITILTIKH